MRTAFYFIVTCFISTGAFWGALFAKNPFPAYAVAFGIWALFIWGQSRRSKKADERRSMERLFQSHMRLKYRNTNR